MAQDCIFDNSLSWDFAASSLYSLFPDLPLFIWV
jgi:hypothetical protein